jgi:hypothetical protein
LIRKAEWPGIATAVGVVLIMALIIVGSRDDFHLKDWQTLIAGLFALSGGALAYMGAMAKVKQDGDLARGEFLRRQLSAFLKLDITIRNLRDVARGREEAILFFDPDTRVRVDSLRVLEPLELQEAWGNLDVFPRHMIREIALIRERIRRLEVLMEGLPDDALVRVGERGGETRLDLVHEEMGGIAEACSVIADGLAPEIERLAPARSERDRTAAYGED